MLQITYFFNKLKFYSMVAAAAVSSSDATAAAFLLLLFVVSLFKLENENKRRLALPRSCQRQRQPCEILVCWSLKSFESAHDHEPQKKYG